MNAQPTTLEDLLKGDSRCARLARLFISRRGEWVDGRELATVAGVYAWRSRCADLRKRPWLLSIENRVRRVGDVKVSEYRLSHG